MRILFIDESNCDLCNEYIQLKLYANEIPYFFYINQKKICLIKTNYSKIAFLLTYLDLL